MVEVVRMNGDVKALYRGGQEREAEAGDPPTECRESTAAICGNQADQEE